MRVTVNLAPLAFAEYPQPETHNAPPMHAAASISRNDHWASERLRVFAKPNMEMNPQGMTQPKAIVPPGEGWGVCTGAKAAWLETIMVTVLTTGAPLGVTLEGLKVQVTPLGNPEQVEVDRQVKPIFWYQGHSQIRCLPRSEVYAGRAHHHRILGS